MFSAAKGRFLERFQEVVLAPREMDYKVQFTGPTGTNAVEAALKLARKVTGRHNVIAFTNGFHGMTLGALAATGNAMKRGGAGLPLGHVTRMPFDGYLGDGVDTLDYLEAMLDDAGSGVDLPAAAILETIQAEGGVKLASFDWLRRLKSILDRHGVLLIVDDIQVGCGRTGPFFSFEPAGIEPDMICLSKSLSGFGLPFALVLLKPEHDLWQPGEHNATFRGHNLAFVTATAALDYWRDDTLSKAVVAKAELARERLEELITLDPRAAGEVLGRGLIQGVAFEDRSLASAISAAAFRRGVIIETAGVDDQVLKLLPPLTIPDEALTAGIATLRESLEAVLAGTGSAARAPAEPAAAAAVS
jgi:diaminobutyrate-2-oxoglutarate transaminase